MYWNGRQAEMLLQTAASEFAGAANTRSFAAAPLGLNTSISRSGDGSCPGVFARGSDMQDVRDGTQDLFCD
jgi:hypothetical protein